VNGFILAAGLGTRLQPLTRVIPKALVPVFGRPLLHRWVHTLEQLGCRQLGCNTHAHAPAVEQYLDTHASGVTIFRESPHILGTAGGIYNAQSFFTKSTHTVVVNADIVTNINIARCLEKISENTVLRNAAIVLVCQHQSQNPTIFTDGRCKLYRGLFKSECSSAHPAVAFTGIAVYHRRFFDFIPRQRTHIQPIWDELSQHDEVAIYTIDPVEQWFDTGTPAQLKNIHISAARAELAFETYFSEQYERCAVQGVVVKRGIGMQSHFSDSWIEEPRASRAASIKNSLVYPGSIIETGEHIVNTICYSTLRIPCASS